MAAISPEVTPTRLAAPRRGTIPADDDDDSHPEDAGMAGHLQGQAQGDLGDDDQRGEQRQQDELKGGKVALFHGWVTSIRSTS